MQTFDAVVLGGGPSGMTAALYLLRSELNVALVEKLSPGGQMLLTEKLENYPGFPSGVMGYELTDLMEKHVKEWSGDNLTRFTEEVLKIEVANKDEGSYKLLCGDEWIETKAIIVTTGARYKRLNLPGETELTGKGVSFCALCDGNFFRDMDVAVIGGGNSALEESLYLARLVKKLYLVHRRDDFRAAKCYQDKCFVNPKIETLRSHVPVAILGEDEVTGLRVKDLKKDEEYDLKVDGVFIFVGFEPQTGFFPEGLELDEQGFIKTDQEMVTSLPGIFAAGDIRSKMCRQVATAVGDGATAANSAMTYLENYGS